jgi:HSP20 family protein
MLMRTDPFRELDRLSDTVFGTRTRAMMMPMEAYRDNNTFVVHMDLPGVAADSVDADDLNAKYDSGVLTISIPVAEKAKPRKLAVTGESGQAEIQGLGDEDALARRLSATSGNRMFGALARRSHSEMDHRLSRAHGRNWSVAKISGGVSLAEQPGDFPYFESEFLSRA